MGKLFSISFVCFFLEVSILDATTTTTSSTTHYESFKDPEFNPNPVETINNNNDDKNLSNPELGCRIEPPPFQCLPHFVNGTMYTDLFMMHYIDKSKENVIADCERYAGRYNRQFADQEVDMVCIFWPANESPWKATENQASFATKTKEQCEILVSTVLNPRILAINQTRASLFGCGLVHEPTGYTLVSYPGNYACEWTEIVVNDLFQQKLEFYALPGRNLSAFDVDFDGILRDPLDKNHRIDTMVVYDFAPLILDRDRSQVTCGTLDDIRYTLETNASTFFIQATSGVIAGVFTTPGVYSFTIIAVDFGGQTDIVEEYTIEAVRPPDLFLDVLENRSIDSNRSTVDWGLDNITDERFLEEVAEYLDPTVPRTYYPDREYKFLPPIINLSNSVLSGGTFDDVRYELRGEPITMYVNSRWGMIYGEFLLPAGPNQSRPAYNFSLYAFDLNRQSQLIEEYSFIVSPTPTLELVLNDDRPAKSASGQLYDNPSQDFYIVNVPYLFAPIPIDKEKTTVSDGTVEDLQYILENAPEGFYINSYSGEIFGRFLEPGLENISVLVRDMGGKSKTLENFTFDVKEAPQFALVEGWDEKDLNMENVESIYALNDTYNLHPLLNISKTNMFVNPGQGFDSIIFVHRCLKDNATTDCPGEFLVDGKSGNMLLQLTEEVPRDANITSRFSARDGWGAEVHVLEWNFSVLPKDEANLANGPRGRGCERGEIEDLVPFDGEFTCKCDSGGGGPNCDAVEDNTTRDWVIAGAFMFIFSVTIIGVLVAMRYYGFRLRYKPVDFNEKYNQMIEMGEFDSLQISHEKVPREIKRKFVQKIDVLGKGAFGEVWKAMLDESPDGGPAGYLVAMKLVLEDKVSKEATDDLLREAGVMAQLSPHPNLVQLVGVITRGQPLMMLMSYCEHGSLVKFLKTRAEAGEFLDAYEQLTAASQIAAGMEHLVKHHFIHRDLACRNVLLASGMVNKVADFGLSRGAEQHGSNDEYYRSSHGVFPVRWTSPEAMETLKFSVASDVWSYGITVIEIFQHGIMPYFGKTNAQVMNYVMAGKVHERPRHCPREVYAILQKCWDKNPHMRPSFSDIRVLLLKCDNRLQEHGSSEVNQLRKLENLGLRGITVSGNSKSGSSDSRESEKKESTLSRESFKDCLPFPEADTTAYEYAEAVEEHVRLTSTEGELNVAKHSSVVLKIESVDPDNASVDDDDIGHTDSNDSADIVPLYSVFSTSDALEQQQENNSKPASPKIPDRPSLKNKKIKPICLQATPPSIEEDAPLYLEPVKAVSEEHTYSEPLSPTKPITHLDLQLTTNTKTTSVV
eukprot:m.274414 g.274414  ORF g.274414 m.274414 type:complete len:1312 (-) comp16288_c1_seq5:53-3988(-)